MAVSRRLRSASDFGFILRLARGSRSDGSVVGVLWERVFLRIDFGGCDDVDILKSEYRETTEILMFLWEVGIVQMFVSRNVIVI